MCLFEIASHDRTDIKRKKNVLIYKEIQKGVVAKAYITNGLLIFDKKFAPFLIY
jgi:hypothetical protein